MSDSHKDRFNSCPPAAATAVKKTRGAQDTIHTEKEKARKRKKVAVAPNPAPAPLAEDDGEEEVDSDGEEKVKKVLAAIF